MSDDCADRRGANAVSPTFARELRGAMLRIRYDDGVKSVAVTAEGKVFCAGGDLKLSTPGATRWPATPTTC